MTASGNVIIKHGSKTIKARSIVYNKKRDTLKIDEIIEFIDGNKIRISANLGELDSSLNRGMLSLVKVVLDQQIKIDADSVEYKDNTLKSEWNYTNNFL